MFVEDSEVMKYSSFQYLKDIETYNTYVEIQKSITLTSAIVQYISYACIHTYINTYANSTVIVEKNENKTTKSNYGIENYILALLPVLPDRIRS